MITNQRVAGKILDAPVLAEQLAARRAEGRTVVHCHGVFDLLHVGHIRHLQEAKEHGDLLVVTITEDRYVNKGPHRPAFTDTLRAEVLAALDFVDYVAISRFPTAVDMITLLRPDVYVKGSEYAQSEQDITGGIIHERDAVAAAGGKIVFTNDITFSSTNLINKFFPSYGSDVQEYLDAFRRSFDIRDVVGVLDRLKGLRVAVVGEAILDEYLYCDQMGKSGKEPVLAMRYNSREMFAGGSLAVANHIANFAESVELITYLGTHDSYEGFCRESLKSNVRPHFIYKDDSPTIVKRRYVENYLHSKMFEVYLFNDEHISPSEDDELARLFDSVLPSVDLVVTADFGHGLLTPKGVAELCGRKQFLAVNTQINAANLGFHTISKFPRADYVSIHEGEVRLDARSRRGDLDLLAEGLARQMSCENILVTRGRLGSTLYSRGTPYFSPAFATKVVDRIGSGDAVLAITSMCAAAGAPPEIVGFIGSVVGAQAVAIMGNRTSIDRVATQRFIESLLK